MVRRGHFPDSAVVVEVIRTQLQEALKHPNVAAFLRVIRAGESSQDDSAYTIMFGGSHFEGFADHPRKAVTAGNYTSTAAGAYQFLAKTWDGLVKQYGFPDFSPTCQDEGAVALIAGRGALGDLESGDVDAALTKCGREWASLPGSPYDQPVMSRAKALAVYQQYGGVIGAQVMAPEPGPSVVDAPMPPRAPRQKSVEEELNQPTQGKPMGALAAFLPTIIGAVPKLVELFGSGSDVATRNVKAAQAVADLAVSATNSVNLQAATEKIEADPAAKASFEAAVQANWFQLQQAATVISAAAEVDRKDMDAAAARMASIPPEQLRPFYFILGGQFILTMLVLLGCFIMIGFVLYMGDEAPDLPGWATMILGNLIIAIALEWRSALNFVLGTNKDSQTKTAMIAQMSPPK